MNENEMIFSTAGDLFQHWSSAGYPDYVTGVWSTDGGMDNLTVGVLENEAGEAGKQEILDLVEHDATVTFVSQTYSRNYLLQIQEELLPYFKQEELGMVANGLYDTENHIQVEIHTDKANDEASLNFITELKSMYGDAVSVVYTDGIPVDTLEEIGISDPLTYSPVPEGSRFSPLLAIGLIGIPLLVFGTYFVLRKRFVPALQTNTGNTVTTGRKPSAREVKDLVKESSLKVPDGLDEKVLKAIKHQAK
ncbi:MAG: hypothetical protein IJW37_07605 [Lachnospiraceae bacterium]|nr:hypothetical protein [Lachnospiraceae bacterium]